MCDRKRLEGGRGVEPKPAKKLQIMSLVLFYGHLNFFINIFLLSALPCSNYLVLLLLWFDSESLRLLSKCIVLECAFISRYFFFQDYIAMIREMPWLFKSARTSCLSPSRQNICPWPSLRPSTQAPAGQPNTSLLTLSITSRSPLSHHC